MSYILFILYILIITIYFQNAATILDLQMKKVSEHRSLLVTNIRLGTPSQRLDVIIDINSNKTFIKLFEPKASTSNSVVEYSQFNFRQTIDNYEVKGLHLKDHAEIGSIFMHHFGFIYLFSVDSFSADLTGINGILGLNMNNDINKPNQFKGDNWDSFIDYGNQMMFKERIVKLNLTTNDHHAISIGAFDENDTPIICENNIQDNQYYFNCFLTGLILGDMGQMNEEVNSIKVNSYAYFSTINQLIFCPEEDFNFIIDEFFEEKLHKKDCYIKELVNQFNKDITKIIMCDYYTIKKMKTINFIFSNQLSISIDGDQLFIPESNGDYVFGIANKKSNNNWVFGYFLFQFIPVAFNHENKKVYFYQENKNILRVIDSNFEFPNNNSSKNQNKFNLFDFSYLQIICLILFILAGIGCFMLYKIYIIIKTHN